MISNMFERIDTLRNAWGSLSFLMAAATMLVGVSFSSPAEAQAPGSYLRSCRNVSQAGPILRAACFRRDGRTTVSTVLDVRGCVGDIANIDGRLTCRRGAVAAPNRPVAPPRNQGDRCHTYATEMISMDARARGMRCPSWRSHSNYDSHYNWCSARPPAAAQRALADWGTRFQGCRFQMGR